MGKNCSCLKGAEEEKQVSLSKPLPLDFIGNLSNRDEHRSEFRNIDMDTGDLIKIQSCMRGFLDRRQVQVMKAPNQVRGLYHELQDNNESPEQPRQEIKEIHPSKVPDYSTYATKNVEHLLGNFVYSETFNDSCTTILLGPVEMENGAIYAGEWNDCKERHGKGCQMWTDGSKYQGYWQHDKANGKGRLIHADGDVYEGFWKNDSFSSYGRHIDVDGNLKEGIYI